jgi:LCP family protein required for cell wall assembly
MSTDDSNAPPSGTGQHFPPGTYASGAAGPRRRSRWKRGLAVTAAVAVLLGAGGMVAAWAYGQQLNGNLHRTNAFAGLVPSSRPTEAVTGALNILLLGSDSRNPDTTAASRSDTIMLLHLDADHKHAYTISIPRDTWTYIPAASSGGNGNTMAKINSAYAWGGVPLTVQTVEHFTGVRIDHVVVVDFSGFKQVTDALGGVDMTVDQTITSIFPPFRVYTKGTRHFTGTEALDYVRQRYQYTDGDFTRERHQQQFLKDLLDKATSSGTLSNPVKLNAFLQAITKSITVDQSFDLVNTALQLSNLRSSDITFLTSPSAGTGWEGGQSVVLADTAKAKALYQAVKNDTVAQWLTPASPSHSATPASPTPAS